MIADYLADPLPEVYGSAHLSVLTISPGNNERAVIPADAIKTALPGVSGVAGWRLCG